MMYIKINAASLLRVQNNACMSSQLYFFPFLLDHDIKNFFYLICYTSIKQVQLSFRNGR